MHKNIIIEGNTIYELDQNCINEKKRRRQKSSACAGKRPASSEIKKKAK